MSQKITVATAADGAVTLTKVEAGLTDVFTTLVSTTEVLSGSMGLVQKGAIFAAGMAAQNYRVNGSWNFLAA